jgi:hypothetical protein
MPKLSVVGRNVVRMLEVLQRLAGTDPWELSPVDRLDALADWERVSAWVESRKAACLAAAAAPDPTDPLDSEDWTREQVAVALHVSPAAAHRRIEHARALDGRLIAARDAMETGGLSVIQAIALIEETAEVDDDTARHVAKTVLDKAVELTPGRFRNLARRAVIAADPQGAARRREQARAGRQVQYWNEPNGMFTLCAQLTAEHGHAVWQALTSTAETWTDDDRTLDQRRADALVALVTGQAEAPQLQPLVQVTIDLPTALGLADNPVSLPGYGPLPPAVGRALAEDADGQRWITDPASGELLDQGRQRYRPSKRLREFIRARDRRCRFPGCTTPAQRSDLDHTTPHDDGGPTTRGNLIPLCRRHHRLKTHTRWRYQRLDDGIVEWTDPHGRTWRDPPARE